MIKTNGKNSKPVIKRDEFIEERSEDIKTVLSFKVDECGTFSSSNIISWKAAFYLKLRDLNEYRQYTFKRQSKNTYTVWRIK